MKLRISGDMHKHPTVDKWIAEMDAWMIANNIDSEKVVFFFEESVYSKYGYQMGLEYHWHIDSADMESGVFVERYLLDTTEVEKMMQRFNAMEVEFFKLKVLDKMQYIASKK